MDTQPAPGLISPATLNSLQRTRSWTLFMAILFILGAVAMVGIGLVNLIMGAVLGVAGENDAPGFLGASPSGIFNIGSGILNLIIGIIYIIPIIVLFRFIGTIPPAVGTGDPAAFAAAMEAQRRIWKTFGILVIVYIALMLLFFVGLAVFGAATFSAIGNSF